MLLVKMGGSVITDKKIYKKFREEAVKRIVENLPQEKLLVVHGGGSFGHILASKYEITSGFEEDKRMGFAQIGLDMMDLNMRILKIFHEKNLPAISIPPLAFHIFGKKMDMSVFRNASQLGFYPVTYGDIIFDATQGINICSGDYLMLNLAREFKPEKVIFLTDVDGIYDRSPSIKGAKLIEVLRRDMNPETAIRVADVTGGIAYKIKIMREIANYSKVYVLNGFYPDRIKKVLNDEEFVGTVIE